MSIVRGLKLLEYIAKGGSTANLSDTARQLEGNRITISRQLSELEEFKFIERISGGGHRLSVDFLSLAAVALDGENLVGTSRLFLERVGEELGLSTYLVVPQGKNVLFMYRYMPNKALVSNISVGSQLPAHLTAPGRVLLARMTRNEVLSLLGSEPLHTTKVGDPTTYSALWPILEKTRVQGVSWSRPGIEEEIDACAAPIIDRNGKGIAAISVAGPSEIFDCNLHITSKTEEVVSKNARDFSSIMQSL